MILKFVNLVRDLPLMFALAFFIWLLVLGFFLNKVYRRNDLIVNAKLLLTLMFICLPVLGLLIYGIADFRKNKMLVVAIIVACTFTIVDIWYFIDYKPTHQRRDISNEKSIVFTATDLVKEFLNHEKKADSLYNNKVVEITGEIEKMEADSTSSTIILKTNIPNSTVSCRLKKKQDIKVGNTAIIKGILTGFILGQVQVNEAVLISQAPPLKLQRPILKDTAVVSLIKDSVKDAGIVKVKQAEAKTYITNKAQVKFLSSTPEEDIEAVNNQGISQLNSGTGQLTFAVLIKGFHFENELMQNHFNDKDYMNSDQFPKSEFKGAIKNINAVNFLKEGTYPVTASGDLTIHGLTHKITAAGTLSIVKGAVNLKSVFKIKRVDYGITTNEVADVLEITVTCKYDSIH
jgi:hypothetical protein